jgi:uncharacterized protein
MHVVNAVTSWVREHTLITFFALAFVLSWSLPMFFPLGPFVAALVVASLTGGLDALKDWASRCLRWRVGLKWYAAAVLVPLAIGLAVVWLNTLLGAPMPMAAQLGPWYSIFLLFPEAIVDAPLFEESAWRGFALPRFPAERTALANTLILAVLLVAWHVPRALADPAITAPYLVAAFGSAILTNWVYYNARESALFAILYHSVANTAGLYFAPMFAGPDLVTYFWLLAAVNGVCALVVVLVTGPSLRRRPAIQAEIA